MRYNPVVKRRRILLNAATMASIVLCVATVVLWVRSRNHLDRVSALNRRRGELAFLSAHGGFSVIVQRRDAFTGDAYEPHKATLWSPHISSGPEPGFGIDEPTVWGFRWDVETMPTEWALVDGGHGTFRTTLRSLRVPYWAIASVLGLPACLAVARARRRKRRSEGRLCSACGYDLRATPDRCPECGRVPT